MTRSQRIAKKINQHIKVWSKNQAKLIVAIDGYAGSGKTTVANLIGKANKQIMILHLDDFINHVNNRRSMMAKAKDKSKVFELSWYRYDLLEKLLRDFRQGKKNINIKTYNYKKNNFNKEKTLNLTKNILLIEGIFLFHPKHKISSLWDKTIYLDINFNKADKLRIGREKRKWGKNYIPENQPGNWTRHFKQAYRRYVKKYHPQKHSDLTIKI